MDPDANLEEQRLTVAVMMTRADSFNEDASDANKALYYKLQAQDGEKLAELVEALDNWISRKGFLPARWSGGARR